MDILLNDKQYKNLVLEVKTPAIERIKIYEDSMYTVVCPLTHRASCKYGANTKWCTAVASNDEHFNDYIKNGILVYVIIKNPSSPDIPKEELSGEYKLAAYYDHGQISWYDMEDHEFLDNDPIIKFLIPQMIKNKIKDFCKRFKEEFSKHYSSLNMHQHILKNENIKVITENDEWSLVSVTKGTINIPKFFEYEMVTSNGSQYIVYFVNKKTNIILYLGIDYGFDLRNELFGIKTLTLEQYKRYFYIDIITPPNPPRREVNASEKTVRHLLSVFLNKIVEDFLSNRQRLGVLFGIRVLPHLLSKGDILTYRHLYSQHYYEFTITNIVDEGNEFEVTCNLAPRQVPKTKRDEQASKKPQIFILKKNELVSKKYSKTKDNKMPQ